MKKSPLIGISLRNGLIAGVLAAIMLIVMYYMGSHPLFILPYFDFRVLLFGIFIFFSLKEFRETHQNGTLYFAQGMLGSFMMIMVTATVAALLIWIFSIVEPRFVSDYIREGIESLKSYPKEEIERLGKGTLERNLEQLPSTNGKQLAGLYFMQSMVIGLFVSIILSVILRKQPK